MFSGRGSVKLGLKIEKMSMRIENYKSKMMISKILNLLRNRAFFGVLELLMASLLFGNRLCANVNYSFAIPVLSIA